MFDGRRHGFTLVEMLVVIAIIGVLAGLLLPALMSVKERGKSVTCQNNLRQLAQAMRIYCIKHKYFPDIGYHPLWEYKNYPTEVIAMDMGWMDRPLKDGGIPPKVILCPSCNIDRHPKWRTSELWNYQTPWNAPVRHYAMNGHCDTTVSERYLLAVNYDCVGDGSNPRPFPDIPNPEAYFQCVKLEDVTHQSSVIIFGDSNDVCLGSGSGHYFDWKITSHRNRVNKRVPTRHRGGGNFAYLDGHVEWKSAQYLLVPHHQDDWLLVADLSNHHLWTP